MENDNHKGITAVKEQDDIFELCKNDVISSQAISLTTDCHVE